MKFSRLIATTAIAALMSTAALADPVAVKDLKDKTQVSLTGSVDNIKNERKFTLRDATGTVDVNITSSQSMVLKKGETVTVNGMVNKGLTGTTIDAAQVSQGNMAANQNNTQNNNMARSTTGTTTTMPSTTAMGKARAFTIQNLPNEGEVSVTGTVKDIANEKRFTLQDATGNIDVDITSENIGAALTKGAEVTVTGNIDNGALGRDINATNISVRSSAQPSAGTDSRTYNNDNNNSNNNTTRSTR